MSVEAEKGDIELKAETLLADKNNLSQLLEKISEELSVIARKWRSQALIQLNLVRK